MSKANPKRLPNRRRPTPEWAGLTEYARETLSPRGGRPRTTAFRAEKMLGHVGTLDNTQVAANRYYGLSEVLCYFGAAVERPDVRQRVVTELAGSYTRLAPPGKLVRPDDILYHSRNNLTYLTSQVERAAWSLPADARFLNRALLCAHRLRVAERRSQLPPEERPEGFNYESAVSAARETYFDGGSEKAIAAMAVDEGVGGITSLFRLHARRWYENDTLGTTEKLPGKPKAYDVAVADVLARHPLDERAMGAMHQIGRGSASMHFNLFGVAMGECVNIEGDVLRFHAERARGREVEATSPDVLHAKALGCPVLSVPGLLEYMVDMVPDALSLADQQIAQAATQQ